jgi:hypothetical protein
MSLILRWRKVDLGRTWNWRVVGSNRSCAWVLWMHNYLAALTEAPIYRQLRRWPGIWALMCGGRKWKRVLLCMSTCLRSWRAHRRWWDGNRESRRCRGKARRRGRHRDGTTAASDFIYGGEQREGVPRWNPLSHGGRRWVTPAELRRWCHVRVTLFPALSILHRARIRAAINGGEMSWRSDPPKTLYHGTFLIQSPDRASLSHFFSDFQMATHPVTYSKVVELYTIYNSTIGTELIGSLDHGWIHTQSWPCYTE